MKKGYTQNYGKNKKSYGAASSVVGKVIGTSRDFCFLSVEGREKDLFISGNNLLGAMHGDTVEAEIEYENPRRSSAIVVKILERGVKSFVGLVQEDRAGKYLLPDDHRLGCRIAVSAEGVKEAKVGDKVVAHVEIYRDGDVPMTVSVTEVLGDAKKPGVDVLSVIRSYELPEKFDAKVMAEAHGFGSEINQADVKGRTDFRGELIITIDGEDAKDLDDAVMVKRLSNGLYELQVHIADVSHYVTEGSALDREAFVRGTSVYFPDRVIPMLPQELSNGICSLNEGVDRFTTSCIMTFDEHGARQETTICKGVIRSTHRMTYTKVQAVLDGDKEARSEYPDLVSPLEDMRALRQILHAHRVARGAVEFNVFEPHIVLDRETGKITEITATPHDLAHGIIEEFMLAANEAVAYKFDHMEAPFVYRVHETPDPAKIEALKVFLSGFALTIDDKDGKVTPQIVQKFLQTTVGKPYELAVSKVTLRSMQKAKYSECCLGHFGLAAEFYAHFTSPIRRYPDLSIHRIIGEYLKHGKAATDRFKDFVIASSLQSSKREVIAQEAEREVDDIKKAAYMLDHLGEEFDGNISGIAPFGMFVELPNTIEGLIRPETLPDSQIEIDDEHYEIRGSLRTYRIGDPIKVRCIAANPEARTVDFVLADTPEEKTRGANAEIKRMSMPNDGSSARNPMGNGVSKNTRGQSHRGGQSGGKGRNGFGGSSNKYNNGHGGKSGAHKKRKG